MPKIAKYANIKSSLNSAILIIDVLEMHFL